MKLLLFLLLGIIISLIINILLLRFSTSLGIRNKNDVIVRWSSQSKPSLGGVSFYISFLLVSILYAIITSKTDNIFDKDEFISLFIAGSLAFVMGLADDAYNTKPYFKLSIQILCGIVFSVFGIQLNLTDSSIINSIATIVWVVILMNSLNMLDNMDGITGTVVTFILVSCLASLYIQRGIDMNIWTVLLISQIGTLLGFLKLNIHPSKLFMGDAGSQFIALFVAFFSIEYLWNFGKQSYMSTWIGMAVCLVAFTPAAADTLTVVINRLKRGQSPMVGGKDHTTHHLVYKGLNDKQVWYVFLILSLLSCVLSVGMLYFASKNIFLPIYLCPLYTIFVFLTLYRITLKYKANK